MSEQAAWIAGAIARHYEREGLTGPDDEFFGEWHALFDQEWQGLSEADSPDFAGDAAGENGGVGEGSGADCGASDFGGGWGGTGLFVKYISTANGAGVCGTVCGIPCPPFWGSRPSNFSLREGSDPEPQAGADAPEAAL